MKPNPIKEAIENCFVSPNVRDSNMESANVVDVIDDVARGLRTIAHAITPLDACPMTTPNGGSVGSLAEAVVYAAQNLELIADAISDLAEAIRSK
jgi:hypothetical protein